MADSDFAPDSARVSVAIRCPTNSPKRDVYAPVIFDENERICMLVPYQVGGIEQVKPVMTSIFADPSLAEAYKGMVRAAG